MSKVIINSYHEFAALLGKNSAHVVGIDKCVYYRWHTTYNGVLQYELTHFLMNSFGYGLNAVKALCEFANYSFAYPICPKKLFKVKRIHINNGFVANGD